MAESNKILKPITYYPAAGQGASSQRRPYSFISGSEIDNIGGAVASNNTAAGIATANSSGSINKNIGSKVINNDESGTKPASGSAFGAVSSVFKSSAPNRNYGSKTKFTRDISAAPTLPILSSTGGAVIGGFTLDKQRVAKHIKLDDAIIADSLNTSTNFNTIFDYQDPSDDIGWSSEFNGTLLIESASSNATAASTTKNFSANVEYIFTFEYVHCIAPLDVNLIVAAYDNVTPIASAIITRLGKYAFSFTPTDNTAQGMILFTIESPNTGKPIYIKNIRLAALVSKDINVSFGTDDEKGKFKNGAAAINNIEYAGI